MTVSQAQNLLSYLGFYKGAVDGAWGPESRSAAQAFQRAFGNLEVDGICGAQTQQALKIAVSQDLFQTKAEEDPFWNRIHYWIREEFRCRCGGKYCDGFPAEPDPALVELADAVRAHFGKPGHSSSGLRCATWNAIQGGASGSRHLRGKALDFRIEGHTAAQVLTCINTLPGVNYAYDIDGTYVHMDVA